MQELDIDARVVDMSQLQHILNQRTGLLGVVGIHLLQSGIVTRRQVEAFYAVVALNGNLTLINGSVRRLQLPLATKAYQHEKHKKTIYLFHEGVRLK